jgi:hypothetical protein
MTRRNATLSVFYLKKLARRDIPLRSSGPAEGCVLITVTQL